MKLSDLKKMFETRDIEQFKKSISQEVSNYENNLSKKGTSIPIIVIEDLTLNISISEAIFLLEAYISEQLTKYEISYIGDALLLSEMIKFDDEELMDHFEMFTELTSESIFSFEKANQMILLFKSMDK